MNFDPSFSPYTKNVSRMIKLNINSKIVNLLEENKGEKFCDLGVGKDFLDMTKNRGFIKEQTDNLRFFKIKNFCPLKTLLSKLND